MTSISQPLPNPWKTLFNYTIKELNTEMISLGSVVLASLVITLFASVFFGSFHSVSFIALAEGFFFFLKSCPRLELSKVFRGFSRVQGRESNKYQTLSGFR